MACDQCGGVGGCFELECSCACHARNAVADKKRALFTILASRCDHIEQARAEPNFKNRDAYLAGQADGMARDMRELLNLCASETTD